MVSSSYDDLLDVFVCEGIPGDYPVPQLCGQVRDRCDWMLLWCITVYQFRMIARYYFRDFVHGGIKCLILVKRKLSYPVCHLNLTVL
jgi:hypothetical protein